eukprot:3216148-Heterocapsa_arctica.AAC.2
MLGCSSSGTWTFSSHLGTRLPELLWILKELGGHSDADIISMASNRHVFAKTIIGISNNYANSLSA